MRLAVLAYDGISPFMLSTPLAVFGEPFVASGHVIVVCAQDRKFSANGALTIETQHSYASCRDADVLILPGWRNADEPVSREIVAELRLAQSRGTIIVGLCLGAFGLAEAGLLDGRRATTHWARAESFANRYPAVKVDAGALFVDEGLVLTSAGVASGLDCCLHLLARISGVTEANRVARQLVVAPLRSGGQPQMIDRPAITSSSDERINSILESLRADLAMRPDLDELAKQAGMSRRSVTRHIRERTGGNLGDWLKHLRLARAQELLAGGTHSIEAVADLSGFPDAQALRTAFRASLGMTPRQWMARQRLN